MNLFLLAFACGFFGGLVAVVQEAIWERYVASQPVPDAAAHC